VTIATFIVAVFAATISLGSLVWQFAIFRLSGGRVTVELAVEVRAPTGIRQRFSSARGAVDFLRLFNDPESARLHFVLTVRNTGRLPVWLSECSIAVGKSSPPLFLMLGLPGENRDSCKLEVGESIVTSHDARTIILMLFAYPNIRPVIDSIPFSGKVMLGTGKAIFSKRDNYGSLAGVIKTENSPWSVLSLPLEHGGAKTAEAAGQDINETGQSETST
jgi:hypothetical protein